MKTIDALSAYEKSMMDTWADKWIDIGLRTGNADRTKFEAAARSCYRYAGLAQPKVIVWVSSPLVLALAAPMAALIIERAKAIAGKRDSVAVHDDAVDGSVGDAIRSSVGAAVHDAVAGAVDAVGDAVDGAVGGVGVAVRHEIDRAVNEAVHDAVRGSVDSGVRDAVGGVVGVVGAVGGAVDRAVDGSVGVVGVAVHEAVNEAVHDAVRGSVDDMRNSIVSRWTNYLGGQFWVGGWYYWGCAWTSFFRDVCKLELDGDLWQRAKAYEETAESACWWWPHRDFIMVCERPTAIHLELVNPDQPRGWNSHRLHNDHGAAVEWADGWGVWSVHGVRVPPHVIDAPETITVAEIENERNAEVRRVMIDRYGQERYLFDAGAKLISRDSYGELYRKEIPNDEPLLMVRVKNSTPEPDGSIKHYTLRVPPDIKSAHEAVAWTFGLTQKEYAPRIET